jgi:peptidase A4-like protein
MTNSPMTPAEGERPSPADQDDSYRRVTSRRSLLCGGAAGAAALIAGPALLSGTAAAATRRLPKGSPMKYSELGVRPFTLPRAGFDPVQASDRELLIYGYPARPDATLAPRWHALWKRVFSRRLTVIQPQFAAMPDRYRTSARNYAPTGGDGWSGSILHAVEGTAFTGLLGQWTVPDVVVPYGGEGFYICATWVGIDGGSGGESGSGDILQAGTTQEITAGSGSSTFAWFEWYPEYPVTISNFGVSPGDIVFCQICVSSPTVASVYMVNSTTGVVTSFTKTAPAGVQVVGDTAEWILECPIGSSGQLAQYGEVYFDSLLAATNAPGAPFSNLVSGGTGYLENMYDVNGQQISTPQAVTDTLITLEYTASS